MSPVWRWVQRLGSVATFQFCRKIPRFRDFVEKFALDFEALKEGGFRQNWKFSAEANLCNTSEEISCALMISNSFDLTSFAFTTEPGNVTVICSLFGTGKNLGVHAATACTDDDSEG